MTRTVCVIPAKAVSERAHGKNQQLCRYTLDAAIEAVGWNNVILSTDSPAITKKAGHFVDIHPRGMSLSEPDVSATTVTVAALDHFEVADDATVVQLLPTSPFRTAEHIKEALALYEARDPGYSAVLSVTPIHSAALCYEGTDGYVTKAESLLPRGFRDSRWNQKHPVFLSNGAIQITSVQLLRYHGSFWKIPKRLPYVMDAWSGFDVDTEEQLAMARALLREEN